MADGFFFDPSPSSAAGPILIEQVLDHVAALSRIKFASDQ